MIAIFKSKRNVTQENPALSITDKHSYHLTIKTVNFSQETGIASLTI